MIPRYRPICTPVHEHQVCGPILYFYPPLDVNSLVAKLSSDEPGVPGSRTDQHLTLDSQSSLGLDRGGLCRSGPENSGLTGLR